MAPSLLLTDRKNNISSAREKMKVLVMEGRIYVLCVSKPLINDLSPVCAASEICAGDLSHCVDMIVHTHEWFLMVQPTLTDY